MKAAAAAAAVCVCALAFGLASGQFIIPNIDFVPIPNEPAVRDNLLVVSEIAMARVRADASVVIAATNCIMDNINFRPIEIFNATRSANTSDSGLPITISHWIELEQRDFDTYRERYFNYINGTLEAVNEQFQTCVANSAEPEIANPDFAAGVTLIPQQSIFLDDTSDIPFWAMYIIASVIIVLFLLALLAWLIGTRRAPHDESEYVEFIEPRKD